MPILYHIGSGVNQGDNNPHRSAACKRALISGKYWTLIDNWQSSSQLKLGMDSHPINIYGATIRIEGRVGNMLIIGCHP